MSFLDDTADLEKSQAIALEIVGAMKSAPNLAIGLDALAHVLTSYLGAGVDQGHFDLAFVQALNDDFHAIVRAALARVAGASSKAVH